MHEIASSRARQQGKTAKPGSIAKLCRVSNDFVVKIRRELMVYGRVLPPSDVQGGVGAQRGAGARTLDQFDRFVLLQLRMEEPSRSLSSYVHWLYEYTGTTVGKSTVSRFFSHQFSVQRLSHQTQPGSV